MSEAPTLREVIAESGGAGPQAKRTGKARIEGIDYVRKSPAEWLASRTATRGTRKPTLAELQASWEVCERVWRESCEAAGWRRQVRRVADGRFSLRYQRALMAAIDYRTATGPPKRKPATKPRKSAKATPKPDATADAHPLGNLPNRPDDSGKREARRMIRRKQEAAKSARVDTERDLIRLYKSELIALGTPAAHAEIERRAAKRAAKRAAREVAA